MSEQKVPHLPCRVVVPPAPGLVVMYRLPQDFEPVAGVQRDRALSVAQIVSWRVRRRSARPRRTPSSDGCHLWGILVAGTFT